MAFVAGLGGGIVGGGLFGGLSQPLNRALEQGTNSLFPNTILTPLELIDLHHRGALTTQAYYDIMKLHGYNYVNAKTYYYSKDALVTPEQASNLLIHDRLNLLYYFENNTVDAFQQASDKAQVRRNFFSRSKRQGYRPSEAVDLFNSNRPLPTFSTILEWMAKEVFEPDKITQFELAAEQPPQLANYMSAYGVPNEEARKYWIAHWNTIGRAAWDEMYQRFREDRNTPTYSDIDTQELEEAGVTWDEVKISETAYNDYYTVLELSPYFRSRGRGAVYNPLPFTVLQQLWQYGVLPYNQMVGRLRDYGYSKRSSELILEAWQRKFPYGQKEPLSDNITWKYSKRLLTKTEATTQLAANGVTADAITFLLDQIDDKIEEKNIDLQLKSIMQRANRLSLTTAQIKALVLPVVGANNTERADYEVEKIEAWVGDRASRINLRIVGKAYGEGRITETQFVSWCQSKFIPQSDIDIAKIAYGPVSS